MKKKSNEEKNLILYTTHLEFAHFKADGRFFRGTLKSQSEDSVKPTWLLIYYIYSVLANCIA